MEVSSAQTNSSQTTVPTQTPSSSKPAAKKSIPLLWIGIVILVIMVGAGIWYMQNQPFSTGESKVYKVGLLTIDNILPNSSNGIKDGAKLAEKLNRTDSIDIEFVIKDTNCDPKAAAQAMKDLAAQGVVAVVGEFCSGATLEAAPIANEKHIPLISAASTSPKITTNGGEYVYRTIPSDALETQFLANAMYSKYHVRKLAILHADDDYGKDARDAIETNFENLGGKIVADEKLEKWQIDATDQLKRIQASNPDALYIVSTYLNGTALINKRALHFDVPVFGPDYFADPEFPKGADGAAEGLVLAAINNGNKSFTEKFQAVFNTSANTYAAQTYDAVLAVMEALKKGATNGETIKSQLDKLEFDGASGHIKFDKNGDVPGNYRLFIIKNNQAIPIE